MQLYHYFIYLLPSVLVVSGSVITRDTFDPEDPSASDPKTPPKTLRKPSYESNPFKDGFDTAPSSCTDFLKPSDQCLKDLQSQPAKNIGAFSGGEFKWDSNNKCNPEQKGRIEVAANDAITLSLFADKEPDQHDAKAIALWKTWIGPDYSTYQKRIAGTLISCLIDFTTAFSCNVENIGRASRFTKDRKFDIILTCSDPHNKCSKKAEQGSVGGYAWTYSGWFGYYYYINMCQPFFDIPSFLHQIEETERRLADGDKEWAVVASQQLNQGQIFLHEMMHLDSIGQPHINDELVSLDATPDGKKIWAYGAKNVHKLARFSRSQGGGAERASTNADSYAWLVNSKYWWELTGYFPIPPGYRSPDTKVDAEGMDSFFVHLGNVTGIQRTDTESRFETALSGYTSGPPGKLALSIAMVSNVASQGQSAEITGAWNFYTTNKGGIPVGSCGETEGEKLTPKPGSSDTKLSRNVAENFENPPWPGGEFKFDINGEECVYKNSGDSPGRLYCPRKQYSCQEDSAKSNNKGYKKCGTSQYFHAVVFCDF
ncbi:unnamed protein product [Periconia digitata]|uniref:Uncharacterized protein n=1 Tax=Periconia digitata TaxID=1303443 RepID=A0A9W4UV23_9PLEO|nr:unnamed protein product [Periconia digitata]